MSTPQPRESGHTPDGAEAMSAGSEADRELAVAILEAIFVPIGKIFGEAFTADDKQIAPLIAQHTQAAVAAHGGTET